VVSRAICTPAAAEADDLVEAIQSAADVERWRRRPGRCEAAAAMVDRGEGAERIGEWIAMLNDLIVQAAIDLAEAEFELPMVRWCWLAFGSEGVWSKPHRSGQRPDLCHRQWRGRRPSRRAFRLPSGSTGARCLRFSALQGRGDGGQSAVVFIPG
jgi:hypothetical protein